MPCGEAARSVPPRAGFDEEVLGIGHGRFRIAQSDLPTAVRRKGRQEIRATSPRVASALLYPIPTANPLGLHTGSSAVGCPYDSPGQNSGFSPDSLDCIACDVTLVAGVGKLNLKRCVPHDFKLRSFPALPTSW